MKRTWPLTAACACWLAQPLSAAQGTAHAAQAKVEEARTLLSSGRAEQALELFREAVRLDPNNSAAHNALGSMLNMSGRYAEALPHAEAAARLEPTNMRFRYNRGVVLAEHGRFQEALADFDAALAAQPDLTYGWLERGAIKLSLGDTAGARADWRRAAEKDSKLIWTQWYEATGDFAEGRYAQAAAKFDQVAAAEKQFVPAKLWQALAHGRAGNPITATEAGSTDWPAPVLRFYRGELGEAELIQIAKEDNGSGDARRLGEANFFLAQHALIRGDRVSAERYLRAALAAPAPRHVWRIAAERDLKLLTGS